MRTLTLRMAPTIRAAYGRERTAGTEAERAGDGSGAWRHLERAHIVAQPYPAAHVGSHVAMLGLAARRRERAEALGQLVRIVVAGPASLIGRIPVGSTGRADVPLRATMPLPDDLADLMARR